MKVSVKKNMDIPIGELWRLLRKEWPLPRYDIDKVAVVVSYHSDGRTLDAIRVQWIEVEDLVAISEGGIGG